MGTSRIGANHGFDDGSYRMRPLADRVAMFQDLYAQYLSVEVTRWDSDSRRWLLQLWQQYRRETSRHWGNSAPAVQSRSTIRSVILTILRTHRKEAGRG